MSVRLGDIAPDFTRDSTEGPIHFHQWLGNINGASCFLIQRITRQFAPLNWGRVAKLKGEFDKRNVKVIGLSVDDAVSHHGWAKDIEETQNAKLNFPLLADGDRKVSSLYDMIHPRPMIRLRYAQFS
ncbi:MAG TPA: redoxin domain-containing protein [Candidatus Binataceae bacterium]